MSAFSVIDAPSILGLKPSGVERLPDALRQTGLIQGLKAHYEGSIPPLPFDKRRDPNTLLLNPQGIKAYSQMLSKEVERIVRFGRTPVVLGGDCSILIGNLLALRKLGHYGLFFLDGHADFYLPEVDSTNGEVASMDLAIVTGRGPDILTNIDELKPLVRDEDTVVFGYRDAEEAESYGSPDVRSTKMYVQSLDEVRQTGAKRAATEALGWLMQKPIDGFWIHLDVDVLDDAVMPAVDYRMPDGLSFDELAEVLNVLISSPKAVGIEITIFNPSLDPDGSIARNLTAALVAGLAPELSLPPL